VSTEAPQVTRLCPSSDDKQARDRWLSRIANAAHAYWGDSNRELRALSDGTRSYVFFSVSVDVVGAAPSHDRQWLKESALGLENRLARDGIWRNLVYRAEPALDDRALRQMSSMFAAQTRGMEEWQRGQRTPAGFYAAFAKYEIRIVLEPRRKVSLLWSEVKGRWDDGPDGVTFVADSPRPAGNEAVTVFGEMQTVDVGCNASEEGASPEEDCDYEAGAVVSERGRDHWVARGIAPEDGRNVSDLLEAARRDAQHEVCRRVGVTVMRLVSAYSGGVVRVADRSATSCVIPPNMLREVCKPARWMLAGNPVWVRHYLVDLGVMHRLVGMTADATKEE